MTTEQRFERDLPELLSGLAGGPKPDYRDDIVRRVATVRQRPAWTFPERWLPMAVLSRRPALTLTMPWRTAGLLVLLLLLVLAAVVTYVGSQRRLPAPFGLAVGGQVAYSSDGDILVRDSLTGQSRVLIGGPERDGYPIHSRQGDRILFIRDPETSAAQLMVADAEGRAAAPIGTPFPNLSRLEWSPSGSTIAVGWEDAGSPAITIVRTDGSGSTRLDLGMPADYPTWRPGTDDVLLFRGDATAGPGFYLVRADGTDLRHLELTSPLILGGQYDFLDPAWSPTGDRLAFHHLVAVGAAPDGNGFRIHLANIDPSGTVTGERVVTYDPEADDELQPRWTPTGDGIVFQRREAATDTLHLGTTDGRVMSDFSGTASIAGDGITFDLAPDGTSVLALLLAERDLRRLDVANGESMPLAFAGFDDLPSWQRRAP